MAGQDHSVLTLIMGLFKIIKSTTVKKNDRAKAAQRLPQMAMGRRTVLPSSL